MVVVVVVVVVMVVVVMECGGDGVWWCLVGVVDCIDAGAM